MLANVVQSLKSVHQQRLTLQADNIFCRGGVQSVSGLENAEWSCKERSKDEANNMDQVKTAKFSMKKQQGE